MVNGQYSKRYIQSVSALVVANNKLFLLQRDDNKKIENPRRWQLPWGGVEVGETTGETIRRELQEEIGIVPSSLRFLVSPSARTNVYYAYLTEFEKQKEFLKSLLR